VQLANSDEVPARPILGVDAEKRVQQAEAVTSNTCKPTLLPQRLYLPDVVPLFPEKAHRLGNYSMALAASRATDGIVGLENRYRRWFRLIVHAKFCATLAIDFELKASVHFAPPFFAHLLALPCERFRCAAPASV
jgi:hypothetical protein